MFVCVCVCVCARACVCLCPALRSRGLRRIALTAYYGILRGGVFGQCMK